MKLVELLVFLLVNPLAFVFAQTCSSLYTQCYTGSGSSCTNTSQTPNANGCCALCCAGYVCGGTSDDNQYWAGCRLSSQVTTTAQRRSACDGPTTTTTTAAPATTTKAPTTTQAGTTTKAPTTTQAGTTTKAPTTTQAATTTKAPTTSAPTTQAPVTTAGITTRYWDCCKPSCSWSGKSTTVANPVNSCDANQNVLSPSANVASGCNGGTAFICNNQQPQNTSNPNYALAFAATYINGGSEQTWCCACYALTFTSTAIAGKTLIVQVTNTGADLSGGSSHFDLQIPGSGVGLFNGCQTEYGTYNGGAQYGGVSSVSDCANLPAALQPGCRWRFGNWFEGADNPNINFYRVKCPAALTSLSGCSRNDDSSYPVLLA